MKVLLIDGNSVCMRAKYSVGYLSYMGKGTGIIHGFFLELLHVLKKYKPDTIAIVWDSRKSKRRKLYPEYKQSRRDKTWTPEEKKYNDDCFLQFDELREEILPAIGLVNNFMTDGFEGDDLIASIIETNPKDSFVIVSNDNDLYQLLEFNAVIHDLRKKSTYTKDDFIKEYNIIPMLWHQVKTLAGCTSDGVKGINKVGEKTAIKFINGDLKQTLKVYKAIRDWDRELYDRNIALVTLPLEGTPKIHLDHTQKIKFVELRSCFLDHGLQSMLGKMDEWKILLHLGRK